MNSIASWPAGLVGGRNVDRLRQQQLNRLGCAAREFGISVLWCALQRSSMSSAQHVLR
jgi:hypothetical protein